MNNKSIVIRILSITIILGSVAACDGVSDGDRSGSNTGSADSKISRPAEKQAYYQIPGQGILIPHSDSAPVFYYRFDQGYLVLSQDENFNDDNTVMERLSRGEYYGGGYQFKFNHRPETDDELIMRLGEEEKVFYKDQPQKSGETYEEYIYRIGKLVFLEKANGKFSSNADGTKPSDGYYNDVFDGAVIIASNGVFHFDLVAK